MQDLTRDRELGRQRDLGFTTLDRKDRAVALLDNRHLHQEPFPASPSPSIQGQEGKADQPDVKHQVRPQRQASGGTTQRFTVRCCRIWFYGSRAACGGARTPRQRGRRRGVRPEPRHCARPWRGRARSRPGRTPCVPGRRTTATEVINKLNHAHQYRLSRDSLDSGHCHGAAAQSRHLLHPFPEKLLFGTALTSRRLGWYYFGSRSRSRLPSSSVISE